MPKFSGSSSYRNSGVFYCLPLQCPAFLTLKMKAARFQKMWIFS